jgi:hypothetical protein
MISAKKLNKDILEISQFKNLPEPVFTFGINERNLYPSLFDKYNTDVFYTCNAYTREVERYSNKGVGQYVGGEKRFFYNEEDAIKDAHNISMSRCCGDLVSSAEKTRKKLKLLKIKKAD